MRTRGRNEDNDEQRAADRQQMRRECINMDEDVLNVSFRSASTQLALRSLATHLVKLALLALLLIPGFTDAPWLSLRWLAEPFL